MNRVDVERLLEEVRAGKISVGDAVGRLASLPFIALNGANVDTHRELRTGFPEVVFGQGKTEAEVLEIAERILAAHGRVLATRLGLETGRRLAASHPDALHIERSGIVWIDRIKRPVTGKTVVVISAGTSDQPVADEAAVTASACGRPVEKIYDTGVAGLHRLLAHDERIRAAGVKVVVAGMEGALPSVVAGLFGGPVIAVPTSVGYGVSAGGFAALATMLSSCATGIAVVNIDNGFGAGVLAAQIAAP